MRVNTARMRRNLDLTKGLVFSGQVLLDLAAAGMLREQAYQIVQGEAMRAWNEEGDFRAAIEAHSEVRAHLNKEQIERAFSVERQLKNVDALFARVFGHDAA
jgi:adenylosuccinate lyase